MKPCPDCASPVLYAGHGPAALCVGCKRRRINSRRRRWLADSPTARTSMRDHQRNYNLRTREQQKEYSRRYRERNPERVRQTNKAWHARNPGYDSQYGEARRETKRDGMAAIRETAARAAFRSGPWSDTEIWRSRQMWADGLSVLEIALTLGRTYASVIHQRARQRRITCPPLSSSPEVPPR